jgi:hypothetical protein
MTIQIPFVQTEQFMQKTYLPISNQQKKKKDQMASHHCQYGPPSNLRIDTLAATSFISFFFAMTMTMRRFRLSRLGSRWSRSGSRWNWLGSR